MKREEREKLEEEEKNPAYGRQRISPPMRMEGPIQFWRICVIYLERRKKSRIRETKHLSTDADSSTDTTVGWIKNTQKPKFFVKRKKSSKTQKLKKSRNMQKLAIHPSTRSL